MNIHLLFYLLHFFYLVNSMYQSETKMTNQIFNATERLMASEGLHSLSMHKIAKEANISPGTIYIYFKNKDELLRRFARQIFVLFLKRWEKIMMKAYHFLSNIDECGGTFGIC